MDYASVDSVNDLCRKETWRPRGRGNGSRILLTYYVAVMIDIRAGSRISLRTPSLLTLSYRSLSSGCKEGDDQCSTRLLRPELGLSLWILLKTEKPAAPTDIYGSIKMPKADAPTQTTRGCVAKIDSVDSIYLQEHH